LKKPCKISFGIERCTWKCCTARQNTRWKVGIRTAPAIVASEDAISSQRKSISSESSADRFDSTRLARKGPRKEFDVRDNSIRMLNNASDTAIRRMRTPAMRTE
jgi:hypothetical protein